MLSGPLVHESNSTTDDASSLPEQRVHPSQESLQETSAASALGGLVGLESPDQRASVDDLAESLQKTRLTLESDTHPPLDAKDSRNPFIYENRSTARSISSLSHHPSTGLKRHMVPKADGTLLSSSLPSELSSRLHAYKSPEETKSELKSSQLLSRPPSHFSRRQQQVYSSYSPASPLRMSSDQHLQMRLSTSRNLLAKQVTRPHVSDNVSSTPHSTTLSKRINLRTKNIRNRPRSVRHGPLYKLSVNLVQTYMKINESYFAAEARRKRNQQLKDAALAQQTPINQSNLEPALVYEDANNDYIVRPGEIWNEGFQVVKLLGKGSFGQVVEAISLKTNEKVAIKIIKNKRAFYNQAQVEIKILEFLNRKDDTNSKCIVKMKEHFIHRNHLCLVYELLSINLYELLHATQFHGISLGLVRVFAQQILTALKFLSRPDIKVIHCDLKPENILLREPGSEMLKVIDFGSSCFHSERVYSYIQSRFYRSPEIILGYPYTVQIDIWSLGCILVELLCGEPLFPGQNEHDQLCRICDVLGSIPPDRLIEDSLAAKISKFFLPVRDYNAGVNNTEKQMKNHPGSSSASTSSAKWRLIPNAGFRPSGKSVKDLVLDKAQKSRPFPVSPEQSEPKVKEADATISYPSSPSLTDYYHFIELVMNMLQFHPSDRISAEEASQHSFFTANMDLGCNTDLTGIQDPSHRPPSVYGQSPCNSHHPKPTTPLTSFPERSPSVTPSLYETDSPCSMMTYKLMSGRNVGIEKRNIGIQSASSPYPRYSSNDYRNTETESKMGGMATALFVESLLSMVVSKRMGLLGGGQLGRMMMEAANRLNIQVCVLDQPGNPAAALAASVQHVDGDFRNAEHIQLLAQECDVLTVEIEHVNVLALELALASCPHLQVHPFPETIRIIQDKFLQKQHMVKHGVPVADFMEIESGNEAHCIELAAQHYGYPIMIKTKKLAYDGRGNYLVKTKQDIPAALHALQNAELYAEKFVPFVKELAVMVAKSSSQMVSYPVVETIQQDNICHLVMAPAQIDGKIAQKARILAEKSVACLSGSGVFGVEMFLLQNGNVIMNEIAPRPHNSGHYSIEACYTSQFEQHVRAVCDLPLGRPELKVPASVMVNVLGTGSGEEGMKDLFNLCAKSMTLPGTTVHLYGKKECRKGRKMAHITIVGETMQQVISVANQLVSPDFKSYSLLNQTRLSPVVGIIMGSDSDLPTLKPAAEILEQFGVPFEISIVSAHRTPDRMMEYAKMAHERGIKVIIAAAGGAAHLPGMVAAITPLPVIGVPVALKYLDGMDSLYSIVQMPRGVPVATVAINNSTNAALLAVRILGASTPRYLTLLQEYQATQKQVVLDKVDKLDNLGWKDY